MHSYHQMLLNLTDWAFKLIESRISVKISVHCPLLAVNSTYTIVDTLQSQLTM